MFGPQYVLTQPGTILGGSETMVVGDPMLILGVADVSPEERKKRKAERLRRFSEQMGFEATNLDPLSAVPMSGVFPLSELQRTLQKVKALRTHLTATLTSPSCHLQA
jgi:hypothetical protein